MEVTEQGLTEKEARERLAIDGPNCISEHRGKSWLVTFLEQLRDPLIYVLAVAAVISLMLREYSDAAIIVAVVLLNAMVGTVQEGKARKALEALRELQSPRACVIREGKPREIPASELVVGDLVFLEAGMKVPADLRLVETIRCKIEESALTGESLPAGKQAPGAKVFQKAKETDGTRLHRSDLAFQSTLVVEGKAKGIVIATGKNTEIGRIADMIRGEKEELTPLQRRLGEMGTVLSLLSLFLCAALFGIAVLQKRDVMQMLLAAISLAVAAVPEGLPAVVTICLALSVTRLVKAGTIVRRLPSVETLGAVNVVCSDKTGTLTQNRMRAEMGYWDGHARSLPQGNSPGGEAPPKEYLQGLLLCNNASLETGIGDPTELALLELGRRFGLARESLERELPRLEEIPFSSERKQMTTFHRHARGRIGFRKGAPDQILQACQTVLVHGRERRLGEKERGEILKVTEEMAGMAWRTLAVAMQRSEELSSEWTFLGLVALGDPPRPEAAGAVKSLEEAGVETIMITGDHVATAFAVGKRLGIARQKSQCLTGQMLESLSEAELAKEMERRSLRIFARVTPAQKMQIVKALQLQGKIVAMTGDGVNDAPSLRAAQVGIAMGKSGTEVAKEAADLVLTDDNFATIERAIEEGRGVYENIRKSVIFLLSSNLGELLTMFVAVAFGFSAPLRSSHVLWINLITDSLPALALGVDHNDGKALMRCAPRQSKETLFARGGLGCTCFYGLLIAGISLAAFLLPEGDLMRRQTYAFTVLGVSQLFHAIGMRDVTRPVLRKGMFQNRIMLLAFSLGVALQAAVTEIPVLCHAFGTVRLSFAEWGTLLGLASVPLILHEVIAWSSSAGSKKRE